jgi:DNA repair protein RecN (Recombination protein N)
MPLSKIANMIEQLKISNYATIKDIQIKFKSGLNIITGETGSGKSLIVDAISTALGSRLDRRSVKPTQGETEINLTINQNKPVVLTRLIPPTGTTKNLIGGKSAKVQELKYFSDTEIMIFGQHSITELLSPENYSFYLDAYADSVNQTGQLREFLETYLNHKKKLKNLINSQTRLAEQYQLAEYQLQEIESLNPDPREWEELNNQISKLENFEKLKTLASEIEELLEGDQLSLTYLLSEIESRIDNLQVLDSDMHQLSDLKDQMIIAKDELSNQLRGYSDLEFDEELLTELRDRRQTLSKLIKKFGGNIESLLNYRDDLIKKLSSRENHQVEIKNLQHNLELEEDKIIELAQQISKIRKNKSCSLETTILKKLTTLGFDTAIFKIDLLPRTEGIAEIKECFIDWSGIDDIKFKFSANPDLKPALLSEVVSGGELSRLALALQSTILKEKLLPTVVFDEIDTGISGRIAQAVGKYLSDLAGDHQVIVITHLPQIAAFADHYIKIDKQSDHNKVFTKASYANSPEQRIQAIAELAGGEKITPQTLEYVRSLINSRNIGGSIDRAKSS